MQMKSTNKTNDNKDTLRTVTNDNVEHPAHYNMGKIETIDYIESVTSCFNDGFEGKCVGDVIKYISRYPFKNGIEDLRKAKWYLERLIKYEENK